MRLFNPAPHGGHLPGGEKLLYIICFAVSLILLLILASYEKAVDIHMTILAVLITVGCGGYYALSVAHNLEEAILANKIIYVTGCFSPLLVLLIICGICRIPVPKPVRLILYLLQIFTYFAVWTIGSNSLFYKYVEFHQGAAGGYLVKTYGPLHGLYLITLLLYTLASIAVGLYSLNRSNIVSRFNVYALLFADLIAVGIYLMERMIHLQFDLMPVIFSSGACIYLVLLLRLASFSIYNNRNLLDERIRDTAYIFFSKNLKYMGCSDCATEFFPELSQWKLEEKIPGSGGRFNTFLRQPLLYYTKEGEQASPVSHTYTYKDRVYRYEIAPLLKGNQRMGGYAIQVVDVTDLLTATNEAAE